MATRRPLIGITTDRSDGRHRVSGAYVEQVARAGGTPILLPELESCIGSYLACCDGIILTGGDDPIMERWGVQTHPEATPVHPERQSFDQALLDALAAHRSMPVMGVCLGMQYMGLHAGGSLDQHLPGHLPTAAMHAPHVEHEVSGAIGRGIVHSHHHQALRGAGRLAVVAEADDGVIEAILDPDRAFYLGVQWHPERTDDPVLGPGLFTRLVETARSAPGYHKAGIQSAAT